ncbi:MAG: hypothetical protein LAQ69_11260 [Acidobacteriia bacterium]|nr:hypothetical protein [Terriglobia bacterium]
MISNSMKAVAGRIRRLEVRFRSKAPVPSVEEAIVERLAAGDWQSALKLLEPRERDLWQERQSMEHRGRGPNRPIHIDFTDLTRLRQTLSSSLADLPPKLREKMAQQLLAADTEEGRVSRFVV